MNGYDILPPPSLNSRKWLYELKHQIVEAKNRGEAVKMTVQRAVILGFPLLRVNYM
jgi:hypothetical protein